MIEPAFARGTAKCLAMQVPAGDAAARAGRTRPSAPRPARAAGPRRSAVALVREAVAAGLPALDEWRSKRLLAAYGVPVPAGALASGRSRGGRSGSPHRRPVAIKAVGAQIHHKTEGGLVLLRIPAGDAAAVTEAYRLISRPGRRRTRGCARRGDARRRPGTARRPQAGPRIRTCGGLWPRRGADRGVGRCRARYRPPERARHRRAPRSHPGQEAVGTVPGLPGRRPRAAREFFLRVFTRSVQHILQDIMSYARQVHNLLIGERTAEEIKIQAGSAFSLESEGAVLLRGRDLATGLPKSVEVSGVEIRDALSGSINAIVDAVRSTIEITPPELIADLMAHGIALAGGGALLRGLDRRLAQETRFPVYVSEEPLTCVVRGTGEVLEEAEILAKVQSQLAQRRPPH